MNTAEYNQALMVVRNAECYSFTEVRAAISFILGTVDAPIEHVTEAIEAL